MVKDIGGFRTRTRDKLKKHFRQKGKISIRRYFQSFKEGDSVYLSAEPAIQNGMYLPRFHSKVGIVREKQGECYKVEMNDLNKAKILIVHPVHLKLVKLTDKLSKI